MPRYIVEFMCTCDGQRTDGSQGIEMPNAIPSLQHAQQHFTERFRRQVENNTGRAITDLTITDIRLV